MYRDIFKRIIEASQTESLTFLLVQAYQNFPMHQNGRN